MALTSVSDFSSFINPQIEMQEQIETCLWQLEALMTVVIMTDKFYELPEHVLHNYFSIAEDLVEKAVKANQLALSELLKQNRSEATQA